MARDDDIKEAAAFIYRHFGRPDNDGAEPASEDASSELGTFLARRILTLLRRNLGQLTQILYRIDVPEPQVDEAFQAASLDEVAARLAERIVARQLRTVALRRQLEATGGEPESSGDGS